MIGSLSIGSYSFFGKETELHSSFGLLRSGHHKGFLGALLFLGTQRFALSA